MFSLPDLKRAAPRRASPSSALIALGGRFARPLPLSSRLRGFSLLEVLVVVTLLALFASLALPLMNRDSNTRDFAWQAARLRDTLLVLNETSLFRGELLALHLQPDGYRPLRYDPAERSFTPLEESGNLAEFTLPEGIALEWELEAAPRQEGELSLAEAAERLLVEEETSPAEQTLPQLFFFPSGEVTPVRLFLRDVESGEVEQLDVNTMGRVVLGDPALQEAEDAR